MSDLTPDDMVYLPLNTDMGADDHHLDVMFVDYEGQRAAPIYTIGSDTSVFAMDDNRRIFWIKIQFGFLMSILEQDDLIIVNRGLPDNYLMMRGEESAV